MTASLSTSELCRSSMLKNVEVLEPLFFYAGRKSAYNLEAFCEEDRPLIWRWLVLLGSSLSFQAKKQQLLEYFEDAVRNPDLVPRLERVKRQIARTPCPDVLQEFYSKLSPGWIAWGSESYVFDRLIYLASTPSFSDAHKKVSVDGTDDGPTFFDLAFFWVRCGYRPDNPPCSLYSVEGLFAERILGLPRERLLYRCRGMYLDRLRSLPRFTYQERPFWVRRGILP